MRAVIAKFEAFLHKHRTSPLVHLNLLIYCNVTSPSEKQLHKFFEKYRHRCKLVTTTFSMQRDLQWFKLDHKLILPHHIMSEEEVDAELRKDGIDVTHLPHLLTSDPVAQLMGLHPGMIVRLCIPLDALTDVVYRLVVEVDKGGSTEEEVVQGEDDPDDTS